MQANGNAGALKKAKLENGFYNIVDGGKLSTSKRLSVINPATGKQLATVPDVDAARHTQYAAQNTSTDRRGKQPEFRSGVHLRAPPFRSTGVRRASRVTNRIWSPR